MVNWSLAQTPDFLSAFNTGYDRGRTRAHDQGVQDALAQLDTNPQGAESALLRYGEVGAANGLRTQRQASERQARTQDAFSRALGGDRQGALEAAASSGDIELYNTLQGMEKSQREAAMAQIPAVVNILGAVKDRTTGPNGTSDTSERQAVAYHFIDQLSGYLPQDQVDQMRERVASADWSDAGIDQQIASLQAMLPTQDPLVVGQGSTAIDRRTGRPIFTAPTAPQRPLVLGPNATALDPVTGQPIFRAPPAPARPSSGRGGGRGSSAPSTTGGGTWRVTGVRP